MGVIAAVLGRHSGAEIEEDQIAHIHFHLPAAAPVQIRQCLIQIGRFPAQVSGLIEIAEDLISPAGQGNGTAAAGALGWAGAPVGLLAAEFQRLSLFLGFSSVDQCLPVSIYLGC